ncbi:MAG: Protein YceG like [Parcubacteria group bacterium]|nr:Protein YceG like [Parcubacteria group bacterium]
MKDARYPGALMPRPGFSKQNKPAPKRKKFSYVTVLVAAFVVAGGIFSLPLILAADLKLAEDAPADTREFPVTVDPATKTITENPTVEAFLDQRPSSHLPAAVGFAGEAFQWLALRIAEIPAYQQIAGAAGVPSLFVTVHAGDRQEQVAAEFGSKLGWSAKQRQEFIASSKKLEPDLVQGSTVPGIYFASVSDPTDTATLVHDRFEKEILSRYGSTTESYVPVADAITIASLLQKEAGGWDDMRLISGIIWNRQFVGMKLQIDATLQYAEATQAKGTTGWWPSVEPKDKYIKSAYNTYQNVGLPPGPIANPSIAAVLAALNPKKTDCLFYFHDKNGQFHCTKTYAAHVALLKKYYGQGK